MHTRFLRLLAVGALAAALLPVLSGAERSAVARRVVSLSPALTETICRLGAGSALVGRCTACDYPEGIRKLPAAGSLGQPHAELLLALHPDLVVTDIGHPRTEWELLQRHGIELRRYPAKRLADYPETVRDLGRRLGKNAEAEAEIARFRHELDALRQSVPAIACGCFCCWGSIRR